jgi:hypothetical protein
MGLLDDAIRQHLELKRQHGAPEEELQRQEEEALGPARRDVAPAEAAGGDGELELHDEEAAEEAPAAPGAHEAETELYEPDAEPQEAETALREPESDTSAEPETAFEPADEPEAAFEPADEPEAAFEPADEPDAGFEPATSADAPELEGVPHPEAAPPSPAPFDAATAFEEFGEEEAEPEAEAGPPEEEFESEEDSDVLEDTPDFLQETPEHDRLWFEQKPPRDFDFD